MTPKQLQYSIHIKDTVQTRANGIGSGPLVMAAVTCKKLASQIERFLTSVPNAIPITVCTTLT